MELITIIIFIISSLLLLLAGEVAIKSRRMHVDISFLSNGIFCVAIGNALMIFSYYIHNLGALLQSFGFVLFFFHYEAMNSGQPNRIITYFIIALFSMVLICELAVMNYFSFNQISFFTFYSSVSIPSNDVITTLETYKTYLYDLIALIVLFDAIGIVNRVNDRVKINATRRELIAIFILVIYRVIYFFWNFLTDELADIFELIALICSVVGIIILLLNYSTHPDYLYLLPFPIHSFMLYNKNGLSCYLHQAETKSELNDEKSQLVTGAFTAINSLIQETLGTKAKLERIQARDFQILFIRLPHDYGTFVVIAHGETAFFQKSLKRFVSSIKPELLNLINEDIVEQNELQSQIDAIAKRAFPYVFS